MSIKETDINDFTECCNRLKAIVNRIKRYEPEAFLYATPQQLNLMRNSEDKEPVCSIFFPAVESGDF